MVNWYLEIACRLFLVYKKYLEDLTKKLFNQGYLELEELVKRLINFKQLIYKSGLSTPVMQRKIKATFWPRDVTSAKIETNVTTMHTQND